MKILHPRKRVLFSFPYLQQQLKSSVLWKPVSQWWSKIENKKVICFTTVYLYSTWLFTTALWARGKALARINTEHNSFEVMFRWRQTGKGLGTNIGILLHAVQWFIRRVHFPLEFIIISNGNRTDWSTIRISDHMISSAIWNK